MKLTQAILPVAGLGTRFLPWTKVVPKELLPIGTRLTDGSVRAFPMIALLVDECLSVGIREICFVISRGKELIPAFFETDATLEAELQKRGKVDLLRDLSRYHEVRFTTVYQEEQRGDGHAILQAASFVTSEHVAVLFGDDLIVGEENGGALKRGEHGEPLLQGLEQLLRATELPSYRATSGALLCLQDVPREQVSRYGIASVELSEGRLKRVTGLIEKPSPEDTPSTLAIVGKYILPRSLFSVLQNVGAGHGGEIRIIDALMEMLALKRRRASGSVPVFGYVFEGRRFDTGTPEGYREAVVELG